jgi:hypothetical protein
LNFHEEFRGAAGIYAALFIPAHGFFIRKLKIEKHASLRLSYNAKGHGNKEMAREHLRK